jgi:hypothetical protein
MSNKEIIVESAKEHEAWFNALKDSATQEAIASLPAAGGGLNTALVSATHALKHFHDEDTIIDLLDGVLRENRGSNYRSGEAARQVNYALRSSGRGTGASVRVKLEPDWPKFEPDLAGRLRIAEYGVYDLWEASPIRYEDGTHTREVLMSLFGPAALITFGRKKRKGEDTGSGFHSHNRRLADLSDTQLSWYDHVVPNVPSENWAMTNEGYLSQHAKALYTYRNYIVVEFDNTVADKDQQAAIILWLGEHWGELVLVVDSGNKSLHAWFYCGGISDDALEVHFRKVVRLGADPNLFDKMQFVRLPDGVRDNGNRQSILYFKP